MTVLVGVLVNSIYAISIAVHPQTCICLTDDHKALHDVSETD